MTNQSLRALMMVGLMAVGAVTIKSAWQRFAPVRVVIGVLDQR